MTAGAAVRPAPARGSRAAPAASFLRLLRIELRRSVVPWILPLIAALFWFDSYRPSTSMPPIWPLRAFWNMGQGHTIIDFGPLVAGVAAWTGSRDGRRGLGDLVTATARPRYGAQVATWAATATWAVGAYLVFVGALFAVYASQGVAGRPPWWWVAVGATAVAAFSAAGFAVGTRWPSRFAAPAATFGGFVAMALSSQTGFRDRSGWALILPTNSNGNFQPDSGIFYPWLPDLPLARIMFLAGIAAAALGVVGLSAWAGGPALRRAAAVVTLAGVAASGTAAGLAGTARLGPHGIVIPALHDAANDRPIASTPVCGEAAGLPVCLNPAYRFDLAGVTAALAPVAREMAGLPGAPARATQIAATYSPGSRRRRGQPTTLTGRPPVLRMPLGADGLASAFGWTRRQSGDEVKLLAVHAFTGAGDRPGTPAQQAVQAALLDRAGVPFAAQPEALSLLGLPSWAQETSPGLAGGAPPASGPGPAGKPAKRATGPIYTAARRLAALPAATRHAWLSSHLPALRAGRLTLKEVP